jgi:hypothetical protein
MIFTEGVSLERFDCVGCAREHHNVSIGEEGVICACGAVISFRRKGNDIIYEHYPRESLAKGLEEAFNTDTRNLC